MRISPKSLSPAEALSKSQARDDERPEVQDEVPEEVAEVAVTSPASIDAGRAQRLLERAAALVGRGDMGAAILATRQSLALAPDRVEAHLMHARLLERNRDFGGARAAYEKSVQLAPNRADARDNLVRLTTYLEKSQGAARQFHFDSDELFSPGSDGAAPQAATPEGNAVIAPELATPQKPEQPLGTEARALLDESMLPVVEARLPPTRFESGQPASSAQDGKQVPAQSSFMAQAEEPNAPAREHASQATAPAAPVGDRRKHNTPVATERRHHPAVTLTPAPVVAAPLIARKSGAATLTPAPRVAATNPFDFDAQLNRPTARAPLALDIPAASAAPLWQQVVSRPSFYARTLPLVGVALLSLGFLSWARGRAVSQVVAPAPTELASTDGTFAPGAPATVPGTTLPVPNNSTQTGAPPATNAAGFPISNAPAVFQAPPAQNSSDANSGASGNVGRTRGNNATSTPARANNRGPNSNSGGGARSRRVLPPARPVPNFPGVSLAPAPIPPANSSPSASQNRGGSNIVLPSPSIDLPEAAAPRQRVLPPTDNGLNPAGSPNRGYVRVTEGRVGNGVIPSQPSAVARDNERAANDAARNGQNDQAISQLSQAIRADSDNAGFRYQQRATLFLQRGDYNRASDDFQSAISAYQTQITNGDDVAGARRGLSSARSGLSLALAGRRG